MDCIRAHGVGVSSAATHGCTYLQGRARGVAHGGEKWLQLHLHDSVAAAVETLRSAGFVLLAAVPPIHAVPPSEPWHNVKTGAANFCRRLQTCHPGPPPMPGAG